MKDDSSVERVLDRGAVVYQADGKGLENCKQATLVKHTTPDGKHIVNFGTAIKAPVQFNRCSLRKRPEQGFRVNEDFTKMFLPGEQRRGKNAAHLPIKLLDNGLYAVGLVPIIDRHNVLIAALDKRTARDRKALQEHKRTGHHTKNKNCKSCKKNKGAKRQSHKKRKGNHHQHATFNDSVSFDVCGPLPLSARKNKYWVIAVDSATHTTEIVAIRTKDESFKGLEAWIRWHGKPRSIRSDNGGEFLPGSKFRKLAKSLGISHRYTVARAPEQNGLAEAGNKVVMTHCRINLEDSGLDNSHWDLAAAAGCYTLDRANRSCCGGQSSFQLRKGRPPTLRQLRRFGSRCYWLPAKDLNLHSSKVDSRRREGTFVGYNRERPAYRVQNNTNKKIYSSADVTFEVNLDDEALEDEGAHEDEETESESDIQVNVAKVERKGGTYRHLITELYGFLSLLLMCFCTFFMCGVGADKKSSTHQNLTRSEIRGALSAERKMNRREWRFLKRKTRKKVDKKDAKLFSFITKNDALYQRYGKKNLAWFSEERLGDAFGELEEQKLVQEAFLNTVRVSQKHAFSPSNPDREKWVEAVKKEYDAFIKKGVFKTITKKELLPTDNVIPLVNLYELKDGGTRFKCRCIVLGNRAPDTVESYAPVCNYSTVRLRLNYALNLSLDVIGFDISEAFLFGELDEADRVIVKPPAEFNLPSGTYWHLEKSLYGLKQSPLCWNRKLDEGLAKLNWTRMSSDGCVYQSPSGNFLVCYVDDCMMVGKTNLAEERAQIMQMFPGREINPVFDKETKTEACKFLGQQININRAKGTLTMTQEELTDKIINKFEKFYGATNPTKSPLNEPLVNEGELRSDFEVRVLAGSLMHLATSTRPDLAFCTKELSRFLESPKESVVAAGKRILGYLKRTRNQGLTYHKIPNFKREDIVQHLRCYCDSDFATEVPGRKSTTGLVVTLNNTPLIWKSVSQRLVSLSTAEAEFIALTTLVQHLKYLDKIIRDMFYGKEDTALEIAFEVYINSLDPYEVLCDNQAAIKIANTEAHELARTKHLDIRTNFIKENIRKKFMTLSYINTTMNVADLFTKPSTGNKLCSLLGGETM